MPLGFDPVGSSALTETQASSTASTVLVAVSGVQGTGQLGSAGPKGALTVTLIGLSASALVGGLSVAGKASASVTGVTAASSLGLFGLARNGNADAYTEGSPALGRVGASFAVTASIPAFVDAVGVTSTGFVGGVVVTGVRSSVEVLADGVSALALLGEALVIQSANVEVAGVQGTMPTVFDIHAMVSSFGGDILQAQPSIWTPVKPA